MSLSIRYCSRHVDMWPGSPDTHRHVAPAVGKFRAKKRGTDSVQIGPMKRVAVKACFLTQTNKAQTSQRHKGVGSPGATSTWPPAMPPAPCLGPWPAASSAPSSSCWLVSPAVNPPCAGLPPPPPCFICNLRAEQRQLKEGRGS